MANTFLKTVALCFAICLIAKVRGATAYNGSYLIVAPKTIRPSSPYSVSVNILDTREPVVVDLSILDEHNATVAKSSGRDFTAGQAQIVNFEKLPAIITAETQYRLHVKAATTSGKVIFEQEQFLRVEGKTRSTFIQTDKAIYKPGSTVHFRVIVVTPDLLAYKGQADIKVVDPNENVIKQFLNQPFDGGVLGKEDKLSLQLSEEPPLGDWKIIVDVDGQKIEKSFTVAKYVLPKYEFSMALPPYVQSEGDVPVNVSAKYTYGKGVAGTVTINAEVRGYFFPSKDFVPDDADLVAEADESADVASSSSSNKADFDRLLFSDYSIGGPLPKQPTRPRPNPNPTFSKTIDLDNSGQAIVNFTHAELVEHKMYNKDLSHYSIEFTATFTEKFTGKQRTAAASLRILKHIEKVEITKQADMFKPGLDYNITISVTTQDGKPLPANSDRTVFLTIINQVPVPPATTTTTMATIGKNQTRTVLFHDYGGFYQDTTDISTKEQLTLDPDGKLLVTLNPLLNAIRLRLEAHYGTNTSEIGTTAYADASKSPTDSYLQLLTESPSVKAGENILFKIRVTKPVPDVTVQVMSKGAIIVSKNVKLSGQTGEISFAATSDMVPKSRIIAYAVRSDDKEILVDAMDFRVEGLFKNNVSINVSPKRAEPNQTVTFAIKAAPKSYVGLLAVDQSVLLLKSGNDITSDLVESDIAGYEAGGRWVGCRWCRWNVRGQDATSVFDNSNVLVFTDAYLYKQPENFGGPIAGGPLAKSGRPGSPGSSQEPTVRKNFPETWLWVDAVSKADGTVTYQAIVPDTITSWVTTAFAISDSEGLGVAPESVKLEVFRPFFIRMDLPYSVKRGEKLALQVLAFNYMETPQQVTITLAHNDTSGFDFIEKSGLTKEKNLNKQLNVRLLTVPGSGGSAVTYFPILPTIVGEIKLLVTAIGTAASDAIEMPLIVEAEGYPIYKTSPFILELNTSTNRLTNSVQLDVPTDIVPGSPKAEFTLNGDIMSPVVSNLDQLLRMPSGCGEQNMLNFVPDIVITRYLKTTGRLTPVVEEKAKRYMESGYQRELTYKRNDASYSAFGQHDVNGSTWLTAFVCRSFKQAKPFIFIDDKMLQASIQYLKTQQKDNGVFEEHGMIHHKAMQGGASQGGVPLTAYILLALLENGEQNANALNYLERNLDRLQNDSYSLALTTYALHLAKSTKKEQAFQYLQQAAIDKDGLKHWTYVIRDDLESKYPWWWEPPRPVDVETTAYALLTYALRDDTEGALPLVRWLASKRTAFGGFSSTQDTVVALQALGAYAAKVFSKDTDISLTVTSGDTKQTFKINPENSIELQSVFLKNLNKSVQLDVSGQGVAYAQVNYHYNVQKRDDPQPFVCDKSIKQNTDSEIVVSICCNYALTGRSNMVVVEAGALSGFTIDHFELNKLTSIKDLKRVELTKGNTLANIYINSLGAEPVCFNITSERSYQVAEQKPALIVVYDYYDPARRIEFEYSVTKSTTLQQVCGDDCWANAEEETGTRTVIATTTTSPKVVNSTTPIASG